MIETSPAGNFDKLPATFITTGNWGNSDHSFDFGFFVDTIPSTPLTCSCEEYLYVNEVDNGGRVHKFKVNADGSLVEINPENTWYPNGGQSELPSPHGLGTDLNGYLYIGSTFESNGNIRKLDCDGNIFPVSDFEIGPVGTHNIFSIGNNLYVKRGDGILQSYDLCYGEMTGEVCLDAWGSNGYNGWPLHIDEDLNFYGAIHYYEDGAIYKFDSTAFDNQCIQPFITGAKLNTGFGESEIFGITTDGEGSIYVVIAGSYPGPSMIRKFDASGNFVKDSPIDWDDSDGVGWYGAIGITYSPLCDCLYTSNGTKNNDCVSRFNLDLEYQGAAVGPVGDSNGNNAYESFNKAIGIVKECCPLLTTQSVEHIVCPDDSGNGDLQDYFLADFLPCERICAGNWEVVSNTAGTFNSCNNSFTYEQAGESCFKYSYDPSPTNANATCDPFEVNVCLTFKSFDVTVSSTDACDGLSNGSASVEISGGTAPFTYDWSTDDPNNDSINISELSAGNYTVTVSDAEGCTKVREITINDNPCPFCDITITATDLSSCNAAEFDAVISLDWEDAPTTGELEYSINDGAYLPIPDGRTNFSSNVTGEIITIPDLTCNTTKKIRFKFVDAPICYEEMLFVFPPSDPAGFIYCEETGEIITGGTIEVTTPPGGSILINDDGSSGRYSWIVTGSPVTEGLYTMTYNSPTGYSNTGIPGDRVGDTDDIFDPTFGSEDNPTSESPILLGSDTINGGNYLNDFSLTSNPFFLDFIVEQNDPFVDLNNIPLAGCCLAPTITALTDQQSCANDIPDSYGLFMIDNIESGDRYHFSSGSIFNDDNGAKTYTNATSLSGITYPLQINTDLANPFGTQDYTIRVFNGRMDCYTDQTITVTLECYDWGDLPDMSSNTVAGDYQTVSLHNGPVHRIVEGLKLGSLIDDETDGESSTNADGDGDDEDGIKFPTTMQISSGGTLNIPLVATNTTGETAYLEMWIDWNGDGDFDDVNEMLVDLDDGSAAFPNYIPISIPVDAIQNQNLGVRIRLSNEDNMTPNGFVDSGEIEDYLIQISCQNACLRISALKNIPN